jgi:flagellin-like protein
VSVVDAPNAVHPVQVAAPDEIMRAHNTSGNAGGGRVTSPLIGVAMMFAMTVALAAIIGAAVI